MSEKNSSEQKSKQAKQTAVKRRSLIYRFPGLFFKTFGLLLALALLCAVGAGYWFLQTESGQRELVSLANKMLDGGQPNGKLRIHISRLSGSLPVNINLGLQLLDDQGVFLDMPENKFVWNWRELPKRLEIESLALNNAVFYRLPDLPGQPPKVESEEPFTLEKARELLGEAAKFMDKPPFWLPEIEIKNIALVNALAPESLLGGANNEKNASQAGRAEKRDSEKRVSEKDEGTDNSATHESIAKKSKDAGSPKENPGKETPAMLRADADMKLALTRAGANANLSARLAAEAGKKARLPDFSFETADLDLNATIRPENDGLSAQAKLEAKIDEPVLEVAEMPADLLGENPVLTMELDARALCPESGAASGASIELKGPVLEAGRIHVQGGGSWQSGANFARNSLDGPLNYNLKISLANAHGIEFGNKSAKISGKDILAMFRAPLELNMSVAGDAERPNLDLGLRCDDIKVAEHGLKHLNLRVDGKKLALDSLEKSESKLQLNLSGSLDGYKLACESGLFYKLLPGSGNFMLHLRDLDLLAAGLRARGNMEAEILSGHKPALDGVLALRVEDWQALSALMPGKNLTGDARVEVDLEVERNAQNAKLNIEIPRFVMTEGKKEIVQLKDFNLAGIVGDIFGKQAIDARLDLKNLQADKVHFGATGTVSGSMEGPLEAKINSSGTVAAKILAKWASRQADVMLDILAAGVRGKGEISAKMFSGHNPAINGSMKLQVEDWKALSAMMPGHKLSGKVNADIELEDVDHVQKAKLNIEIPNFSMAAGKGRPIRINGLNCSGSVVDVFDKPDIDARLVLKNAEAAGMRFGGKAALDGSIAGPLKASLESEGGVAGKILVNWEPGKADIQSLNLRVSMPAQGKNMVLGARSASPIEIIYGENGLTLSNIDLELLPAGKLTARGGLSSEKLDLAMRLSNFSFKPWQTLAPQLPDGILELKADLSGSPSRPGGNFRVAVADLKLPSLVLPPLTVALVGSIEPSGGNMGMLNAKLEIPQQTLKALGGTSSRLDARIPLKFGENGIPEPAMDSPVAAHVAWNGALGPLWNLVPVADMRLNGKINLNMAASGSLSKPSLNGGLNITDAVYENVGLGVLLTAIGLRLNLENVGAPVNGAIPGALRLALQASDGRGGSVSINGGGALGGSNLNIQANINHLRPLRRRDIHAQISGNAKVVGSLLNPAISGKLVVDKGEVLLDNMEIGGGSIVTLPISTPVKNDNKIDKKTASEEAPSASEKGSLNLQIVMPPRFTVEGRGLTSTWQANLLVTGSLENPMITGEVDCYRGNFDFLGKNFVLSRGIVTFAGGSIANPLLDVELTNEQPDLTAHLWITGPVNKIKLSLTSDPSLPRDEILSQVLFGKNINELGRLEALQLAGAVAQLAGFGGNGSSILQMGKKMLGLDVLRLGSSSENGNDGDSPASGTTIEAGKYIYDWLYMGVEQGLKPDSTAFVIEIELTPHSNIEVKTEQSNTWGGYHWKLNY